MNRRARFGLVVLAASILAAAVGRAMVIKFNGFLANEQVAYSKTYPISLNSYGIDHVSASVLASSVTFSAATFTDGQVSTGTIQVVSNTDLAATKASNSLTVGSAADPGSGATITVNGIPLVYGVHWFYDATGSSYTAVSIANAITANVPGVVASTGSSIVYATMTVAGAFGNNGSIVSNTSTITVATAGFSGGKDAAALSINGYPISFTVGATSSNTALSILTGIQANSSLKTLLNVSSTTNGVVVYATSTFVGAAANFAMFSSTQAALKLGGAVTIANGTGTSAMQGGSDAAYTLVNGSATVINATSHGFPLGLQVVYSTSSAQGITGLTYGTTYYVIPVSANSLSLASTLANAQAGTAVVLTSSQTKTAADTFKLTAGGLAGTPSYKWEISDDGINWSGLTTNVYGISVQSVSLGSYVSTGTLSAWDLGPVGYSWLRLNVTAPTAGAIKLQVAINGKNSSN